MPKIRSRAPQQIEPRYAIPLHWTTSDAQANPAHTSVRLGATNAPSFERARRTGVGRERSVFWLRYMDHRGPPLLWLLSPATGISRNAPMAAVNEAIAATINATSSE
jgi:hypothetical protein